MNRLILAVLVVLLVALFLWRRFSRKPAEPAVPPTPPELLEAAAEQEAEAAAGVAAPAVVEELVSPPPAERSPESIEPPLTTVLPAEEPPVLGEPGAEIPEDEAMAEAPAPATEGLALEIEMPPVEMLETVGEEVPFTAEMAGAGVIEAAVVAPKPAPDAEETAARDLVAETVAKEAAMAATEADLTETVPEPAVSESPPSAALEQKEEVAPPTPPVAVVAAETEAPVVVLTLEAYQARMNDLEERQREQLAHALQRGDGKERDRLQRELVIMNSRLALVEDSFIEEQACLQEVLATLEQLHGGSDEAGSAEAMEQLRSGMTRPAEDLLARFSERRHPLATRAAFDSGRLAICRVDLQQAQAMFRRALEREPDNPEYLQAAGMTARNLYNYREAVPWLEAHVRLLGARGSDSLALAKAKRDLAYTYVLSGQHQKAGPLYKDAMTAMARQLGQDHPEMALCWQQIGELQETLGEYDKAVSLYQKALAILEKKRGPEHPALAAILDKLAALCMELEMEKQAVPLYERLVRIRDQALRPTHPQLVKSLGDLAESYRLQGQYAEAEACYRKSLVINETVHGPEHPSVAAVLQELAKLCTSQRKKEDAEQYQQRATAIFQKSVEAAERKEGQQSLTLEL